MPKTSRPRKAYRPGRVNPLSWRAAVQGACKLHIDDRLRWQANLDDALTAIARGQAGNEQWRAVFDAANVVEELVRMKLAHDPDDLVTDAQDACVHILDRQRETGTRAVRAEELAALRTLVLAWAELMDGITQGQLFEAEKRVADRVRRVLSSKRAQAGVRILDSVT